MRAMSDLTRREFVRASGFAALAAYAVACNKGKSPVVTTTSLDSLISGHQPSLQFVSVGTELLSARPERLAFGLADPTVTKIITDATDVKLYFGTSKTAAASGPFPCTFHGDGLPADRGIYETAITFPADGTYLAMVQFTRNGQTAISDIASLRVGRSNAMPIPGERAPAVPTPTFANHRGVSPICTRKPKACSMHDVSLDAALKNGKPTIVIIATPQFCQSQLCGPEVEVLDAVRPSFKDKANFVHIEVYKNDQATTIQRQLLSPAAIAWKLEEEPAIYAIGTDGIIVDRTLGPVDRSDISALIAKIAG
jgi:hypothetical protein